MGKRLCDWSKKEIEKDFDRLHALLFPPAFYCRKCARVAAEKKLLCKGEKLG
ncbi:MAG: hypothetical protein AAF555_04940 [Verrucomicrobiota bacterium]